MYNQMCVIISAPSAASCPRGHILCEFLALPCATAAQVFALLEIWSMHMKAKYL